MNFNSFGEFLRWFHKDDYGTQGMAATSAHNNRVYDQGEELDAREMAKLSGNESKWPLWLERIVLTGMREFEDYDEEIAMIDT